MISYRRLATPASYVGLTLIWLVLAYVLFSALFANTESSIAQQTSMAVGAPHAGIVTFPSDVIGYVLTVNHHAGSLLFDVPFGLLPRPEYFLLPLLAIVFFLLVPGIKGQRQLIKLIVGLGVFVSVVSLVGNTYYATRCITVNVGCLWPKWTVIGLGLYWFFACTVVPVLVVRAQPSKQRHFVRSLKPGFLLLVVFFSLWFISLYLPMLAKKQFAQRYALTNLPSVSKSLPQYIPKLLLAELGRILSSYSTGTSVTTLYSCHGTESPGLSITITPHVSVGSSTGDVYNPKERSLTTIRGSDQITLTLFPECPVDNAESKLRNMAASLEDQNKP